MMGHPVGKSPRAVLPENGRRFAPWLRPFGRRLIPCQDRKNMMAETPHGTPNLEMAEFRVNAGLRPICPNYREGRAQHTQLIWGGTIPVPA